MRECHRYLHAIFLLLKISNRVLFLSNECGEVGPLAKDEYSGRVIYRLESWLLQLIDHRHRILALTKIVLNENSVE